MYNFEISKIIETLEEGSSVTKTWEKKNRVEEYMLIGLLMIMYIILMVFFVVPKMKLNDIYFTVLPVLTALITILSFLIDLRLEGTKEKLILGDSAKRKEGEIQIYLYNKLKLLKI